MNLPVTMHDADGNVINSGDTVHMHNYGEVTFRTITRHDHSGRSDKWTVTWTCDPKSDKCNHSWHRDNTNRQEFYVSRGYVVTCPLCA